MAAPGNDEPTIAPGQVPPTGEEVHLPGPSLVPLATALGIALTLVGITTYFELVIVGLVVLVLSVAKWIRDSKRDIDALPPDHRR